MTLREIANISGGITKGQKYRATDVLRSVPYLRVANVQRGYLDLSEMKVIAATETKISALQLQPGDILFNEGGDRDKLGRGWIWNDELPVCIHQNHVFRARLRNADHSPRFISYYSNSAGQQNFYDQGKHTTNLASINLTRLGELPIPLPPPAEQHRIVAEIEKQFTRLDAGVAALKRVQANLKRYRAAVLKAACEGRLVPTEAELARRECRTFATGEQLLQRILTQRRQWFEKQQIDARTKKKYVEPAKPETQNLPSLPDGWMWGTWNQLSNWVTYGFTRPMPHVDAGMPIVTAKGVTKGRIDFEGAHFTTIDAYVKLSEKDRPLPGDILITKDGTIGRAAVVDTDREFCINQSVAVIWLRSCPMQRKFMLTVIESELTQKPILAKARGVAIQHLSITDFAKMAIPIPPLAEQTRIVAEVERRLSVVEELEAVVSANLQRATRLRQSILQKAFTGNLV